MEAVATGMNVKRYRRLLVELYHVVWHFNPISAAAASRLSDKHKRVRYFLYDHMHEEAGHEEWVLNDLEAIGVGREQARAEVPSTITKALCGYNYWTADRGPPCASLGMMYSLEVIASVYGGTFASAMTEALLLEGDKGISFISSHASMDTEHLRELKDVLNTIEDDDAREGIIESTSVNFHHFTRMFEAV